MYVILLITTFNIKPHLAGVEGGHHAVLAVGIMAHDHGHGVAHHEVGAAIHVVAEFKLHGVAAEREELQVVHRCGVAHISHKRVGGSCGYSGISGLCAVGCGVAGLVIGALVGACRQDSDEEHKGDSECVLHR